MISPGGGSMRARLAAARGHPTPAPPTGTTTEISRGAVVIGEEGSVIGTIWAETVDVRGGVCGAIRGRSVTLRSSAQVEAEITHEMLSIAEGANFDGRVRRAREPQELAVELDPTVIAGRLPQPARPRRQRAKDPSSLPSPDAPSRLNRIALTAFSSRPKSNRRQ